MFPWSHSSWRSDMWSGHQFPLLVLPYNNPITKAWSLFHSIVSKLIILMYAVAYEKYLCEFEALASLMKHMHDVLFRSQ